MHTFLVILTILIALVTLAMTRFVLFRLRQPTTVAVWAIKVFTSGLAPMLLLVALLTIVSGLFLHSVPAIAIGGLSAALYLIHMIVVTRPPDHSTDFKSTFGFDWKDRARPESKAHFLSWRYMFRLPSSSRPIVRYNISFYTIPGTKRSLFCDIWQPPENIKHSGLAFIYLHGSAWTFLDKDCGTRPFFRHLAQQGHVIMDVSYRLFPETGFLGMVHDAKHAIAWIKNHAGEYGVNPETVVIGGGSAGAHIALLAAYTDRDHEFMPEDLESSDLSVRGVISLYGQSDLIATYYHTTQHLTDRSSLAPRKKGEHGGMPSWIRKRIGNDYYRLGFDKDVQPGMLAPILGGNPDEKRGSYLFFSPLSHVQRRCPPTLILHGAQDILAPVNAIRQLYLGLTKFGVPVVMHILPQTDHAFDLILPKISPSAHNAIFDVERFLALMASVPKTASLYKIVQEMPKELI